MLTLPTYDNPPVIEVAAGITFKPLALRSVHLGLLWERFRDEFPRYDERPPLAPASGGRSVRFALLARPPLPRLWLMKEDRSELIQVQSDRFIHNWRQIEPGAMYPRYQHVRELFSTEFTSFQEFLLQHDLKSLDPVQIEVTYVNHVSFGPDFVGPGQLDHLLAPWGGGFSDSFLPEPDDVNLHVRFPIVDEGNPWGRLSVALARSPRGSPSGTPGYRMTLTAAGEPRGSTLAEIEEDMDIAHVWIVKGFTAITTELMHRRWELLR